MPESVNFNHDDCTDISESTGETCPAAGYQKVTVSVPVTVIPFAYAGTPKTKCCGHPVVISGEDHCIGTKNGKCTFIISQTICVEVPIEFGAKTAVGDTYVDCVTASAYDICKHCDCHEEEDS